MLNLIAKFRLLPATIFAASLMLTVKISNIFDGFEGPPDRLPVATAKAQQQVPPAAKPPAPEDQTAEPSKSEAAKKAEPDKDKEASTNQAADADPTLLTQSEIDLLQQLADRREAIEARSEELDLREGLLRAAEQRINKKIEELRNLEKTLQALVKTNDDQADVQMKSLVKIYENMKPKDAARIFEALDLDTLLLVAERMKERKLAPVMAQLNPERAKEITVELTKLRKLPLPARDIGG